MMRLRQYVDFLDIGGMVFNNEDKKIYQVYKKESREQQSREVAYFLLILSIIVVLIFLSDGYYKYANGVFNLLLFSFCFGTASFLAYMLSERYYKQLVASCENKRQIIFRGESIMLFIKRQEKNLAKHLFVLLVEFISAIYFCVEFWIADSAPLLFLSSIIWCGFYSTYRYVDPIGRIKALRYIKKNIMRNDNA